MNVDVLLGLCTHRMVIRVGPGQENEDLRMTILTMVSDGSQRSLFELTMRVVNSFIPADRLKFDPQTHTGKGIRKRLQEVIDFWGEYRPGFLASKEIVVFGQSDGDDIYDDSLPKYNAFFLQELARVETWLLMTLQPNSAITDCPKKMLEEVYGQVNALLHEQNKALANNSLTRLRS